MKRKFELKYFLKLASEREDDFLYHTTFLHNLYSIQQVGLEPSFNSQFGEGYSAHSSGKIFLSDLSGAFFWASKMEDIANYNSDFKQAEDAGWTPIVLRIKKEDINDDLKEDSLGYRDSGYNDSFFIKEIIPSDLIQVWDGEKWIDIDEADDSAMLDKAISSAEFIQDDDEPYSEWGEENGYWDINFDLYLPF
jgi:hypothetical protein